MRSVLYSSPFIPAEWIAAHGLRPARIMPPDCAKRPAPGEGFCPYARAFLEAATGAPEAAAVIFTTECDQMRRSAERAEFFEREMPVFLLPVPAPWRTSKARRLYMEELLRLGRFLVRLGGARPTDRDLVRSLLAFDAARAALHAARGRLSPRRFSEAIARFHRNGSFEEDREGPPAEARRLRGIPVALVGGPLLEPHLELFDRVEEGGGTVALDATTTGERTLAVPFDRRTLREAPFDTLVAAYFDRIPDAFRRPNSLLYSWLKEKFVERGIRGILFKRYTWCDTWHGEARRMQEWSHLPLIEIDTGDEARIPEGTASRIRAFLEILS